MPEFIEITISLLNGFASSVLLFTFTLILALPLGLLIAFCSMSKIAPVRILFKIIVWVLRGTPLLLQIFVVFYVPGLLTRGAFVWPTMNTGWAWFDSTIPQDFLTKTETSEGLSKLIGAAAISVYILAGGALLAAIYAEVMKKLK